MAVRSLAEADDWIPSLRGVFHLVGTFIFAGLGIWMILSSIDAGNEVVAVVYVMSVVAAMATSALYHRVGRHTRYHQFWRKLDHSMILVWIAATYTPLLVLAVASDLSWVLLTTVWGLSVIGIGVRFAVRTPPRWIRAGIPLGLGWMAVVLLPSLVGTIDWWMIMLIAIGGMLYSLGAVAYFLQWPNPLPEHFGFHEVFHVLVLGAAGCHFAALYPIISNTNVA